MSSYCLLTLTSDASYALKAEIIEAEFYPTFNPNDPEHVTSTSKSNHGSDCRDSKPEPRGRSSWSSRSSPFSSLRRRSRSRSDSTSPTRNILARAAELVRAPTNLFYKNSGNDESQNLLIEDLSPSKTINSKKSVHFLPSDEYSDIAPKSSPIPIPGKLAPSLPPLHVSPPEFLDLNIGATVDLSGRPPTTPTVDGQVASSSALPPDYHITLGPAAFSVLEPSESSTEMEQFGYGLDPFDDVEEIHSDSSTENGPAVDTVQPGPISFRQVATLDKQDTECTISQIEGSAPATSNSSPDSNDSDHSKASLVCHKSSVMSLRFRNKNVDEMVTNTPAQDVTSRTSLPLRLKHQSKADKAADILGPTRGKDVDQEYDRQDATEADRPCFGVADRKDPPCSTDQRVHECAVLLDQLRINDDSQVLSKSLNSRCAGKIDNEQNIISPSPERSTSNSPSRRRFRFENTTETSASDPIETSNTPMRKDTHVRVCVQIETSVTHADRLQDSSIKGKNGRLAPPPSPADGSRSSPTHQDHRLQMPPRTQQFRDQHGWSPFADANFVDAAVEEIFQKGDEAFAERICRPGGIFEFWRQAGLPEKTAPQKDSTFSSNHEAEDLVDATVELAHGGHAQGPQKSPGAFIEAQPVLKHDREESSSPTPGNISLSSQDSIAPLKQSDHSDSSSRYDNREPWCLHNPCNCSLRELEMKFIKSYNNTDTTISGGSIFTNEP